MVETIVYCGGLKPKGRQRHIPLELDTSPTAPADRRINLDLGDISRPMLKDLPDELADVVEIACYVYCADQFARRDTLSMPDMGARWHRRFVYHIPVRRPAFWRRPELQDALTRLLGTLSDDTVEFVFSQKGSDTGLQTYFGFSDADHVSRIAPDRVMLFSGGLDSFAGAAEALIGQSEQVAMVSHRSAVMVRSKQDDLIDELRRRTRPGQLFHVGVTANKGPEEALEYTQRSRSFLFAALAFVVARMFRRQEITFYENGVVSVNLPIAEHVLGTRATRTTHPAVLAAMSKLFSLLSDSTFTVGNPYMWMTKADVVGRIEELGCGDLIGQTFSCAHVRDATVSGRHCGRCSQCIDRRFGVLAAGLGHRERSDNYALDLFAGERAPGIDTVMAESFVLAGMKFAGMSQKTFAARYGQVYRAIAHLEGPADVNLTRLHDLHCRHGRAVSFAVDAEMARHGISGLLSLPTNCLLSLIHSQSVPQPILDPAELEPTASEHAVLHPNGDFRWPLRLAVDQTEKCIVLDGGIELLGQHFDLVTALLPQFQADREANVAAGAFGYTKARHVAETLKVTEQTVRQAVSRLRKDLDRSALKRLGTVLAKDDLIQNRRWFGYRLNPTLSLTSAAVLRDANMRSRPEGHNSNLEMSQLHIGEAAE